MSKLIGNRRSIAEKRGGGGGVTITQFATVSDLIEASESPSFKEGYYGVNVGAFHPEFPQVVVYFDGSQFNRELSIIEDSILADVPFWLIKTGRFFENEYRKDETTPAGGGFPAGQVGAWDGFLTDVSALHVSKPSLYSGNIPVLFDGKCLQIGLDSRFQIDGPFEVFTSAQAVDLTETNAGIAGNWNGSNGWILCLQEFNAPNGPLFGLNGVYARGPARIDTNPHVISGRYNSSGDVIVSVDGVDVGSATPGVLTSSNTQPLAIGGYQTTNSVTYMNGYIGEFLFVNRELTAEERTAVIHDIARRAGVTV